jgi:hypothetical protein
MSIFIDVHGSGCNERLSFGLISLADYLLYINPFELSKDESVPIRLPRGKQGFDKKWYAALSNNTLGNTWNQLEVINVRGKNYYRAPHALTVRGDSYNKQLLIFDTDVQSAYTRKVDFTAIEEVVADETVAC